MLRLLVSVLCVLTLALPACDPVLDAPGTGVVQIDPGADVPSFVPWHVTGPHARKTACPLCVYAHRPGAAIWTGPEGLPHVVRLAKSLDQAIAALRPRDAIGYVVLLPDPRTPRAEAADMLRRAFESTPLTHVFLTVADHRNNSEDIEKYHPTPTPGAAVTTILYVNRTASSLAHATAGSPDPNFQRLLTPLFESEEPSSEIAVPMCSKDEPGETLEVYGRVLDEHGRPLPKASVIAYCTDASGLFVPRGSASRTPRLNAVAVTTDDGWYRFRTIRPGGYPGTDDPSHIHFHIDAAVHAHTYRTIWFEDDPRLTPAKRRQLDNETVIVPVRRRPDGAWIARLDVRLQGG